MAAPRHKAGMSHQRPQPKPGYTITAVEWDGAGRLRRVTYTPDIPPPPATRTPAPATVRRGITA